MDNRIIILCFLLLFSCKVKKDIDRSSSSEESKEVVSTDTQLTNSHNERLQINSIRQTLADRGTWISFDGLASISIDASGNVNASANSATIYQESTERISESIDINQATDQDQVIQQSTNSEVIKKSEEKQVKKKIERSSIAGWIICLIIIGAVVFLYFKYLK